MTKAELISKLKDLRGHEIETVIQILRLLWEVQARSLDLEMGYESLYEFAMMELGYDKNEAYLRIRASEILALAPEFENHLRAKQLSPTSLMLAQVAFNQERQRRGAKLTEEEKIAVVRKMVGGSVDQAKRVIAESFPELRKDMEETKPLRAGRTQIKFSVDAEAAAMFEKLKDLLAHKNFGRKWEPLFIEIAKIALAKLEPKAASVEIAVCSNRQQNKRTYISVHTKRSVSSKAEHRCQYVDPESGRRCVSTHALQLDHVVPLALGGTNDISNLRILCGAHNRYVARAMGLKPQPHA